MQVEPILHALALRGHNMTVVSPFPPKKEIPNYRHIQLKADKFLSQMPNRNIIELTQDSPHALFSVKDWKEVADIEMPAILESAVFSDLVRGDSEFDLIFTELFFSQEALVVLGHIFKAPVVSYASFGYRPDILRFAGATNTVAYLPYKELDYAGPMNLLQRLENALVQFGHMIYNEYWYYPQHDALLAKYVPGQLPRITDMLRNVSLHFLTADTALDGAKLYPPNVVEISGIHFKDPAPLDEELQNIMDRAKNGVIYFSFGSILKASFFKREDVRTFLTVFNELDQTVLWKSDFNTSDLDMPKNVHLRDWFDQSSVLAHPNCVLFLTHGGLSSMLEAIRHAVPVIGMPFFSDQIINTANAEHFGYGLRLAYKNLTQKSLRWAVSTVLTDHRFKKNIERASKVFTDKPKSSLDTAIYWIEYVIRHKGAHHLKPLTVHMSWYELFSIDVITVYSAVFIIGLYLIVKLVSFFVKKLVDKNKYLKDKTV
ncbi:UDP-glucosyltransferase 2 [Bemisia tabaci]|uniref:UDP-glucosyltransferase 2 n=1 Tax=Bemisia tabaci TaxID=7038 RepID=UPI003B28BE8E